MEWNNNENIKWNGMKLNEWNESYEIMEWNGMEWNYGMEWNEWN